MVRYPSIATFIYAALAVVSVAQTQISAVPSCATQCLSSFDSVRFGCESIDLKCQCSSEQLARQVSDCLITNCSASDILDAQAYFQQICSSVGEDVSLPVPSEAATSSTSSSEVPFPTGGPNSGNVGPAPDADTTERSASGMTTSTRRAGEASATAESETETSGSASSSTSTSTAGDGSNNNNGGGGGSSSNMPIGLGVGLGVGIPLTIGVIGFIYFLFWKTKRQSPNPATEAGQGDGSHPPETVATTKSPDATKSELAGDVPVQRHELPGEGKHQEMP